MLLIFYSNLYISLFLFITTKIHSFIIINDTDSTNQLYPYESISNIKLPFSILKSSNNHQQYRQTINYQKQFSKLDITSLVDYMKSIYDQTNYYSSSTKNYLFRNGNTIRAIASKINLEEISHLVYEFYVSILL
ncbi:unnamed protein product [Didymodactylos carnosus]|uniref:Uncharacterized protein n=1 Tax=Didymodactylos carnosus TaxID=1234261 RepID=A0A814ZNY4_9BILA|nr:unnamed protein product [Didymodactylos carnosus]CAF1244394.1 unnamed protein product [Didymodactylos carnosus]CAF3809017.1 unnamed protein product [Didymodactylos carnosus]CAF4009174.1 unnamed protein product [Didymodactylos carnosus]